MGTDLDLLPVPARHQHEFAKGGSVTGYDRLSLERDHEVFGQITGCPRGENSVTIPVHPLPPGVDVWTYHDEGIEKSREDRYGVELTFAYAKDLKKLHMPDTKPSMDLAIKAFIDALPDETPIILYWH